MPPGLSGSAVPVGRVVTVHMQKLKERIDDRFALRHWHGIRHDEVTVVIKKAPIRIR